MTAQLTAPCPKCGGATISKGSGTRMCKPCNYRFKWPPIKCVKCGAPKSSGSGRRLPYCDAHYPTERERHTMAYKSAWAHNGKPAAPSRVVKTYTPPPVRKPGAVVVQVGDDRIEITPDGKLILNDGAPLPASPVEVLLWRYITEEPCHA